MPVDVPLKWNTTARLFFAVSMCSVLPGTDRTELDSKAVLGTRSLWPRLQFRIVFPNLAGYVAGSFHYARDLELLLLLLRLWGKVLSRALWYVPKLVLLVGVCVKWTFRIYGACYVRGLSPPVLPSDRPVPLFCFLLLLPLPKGKLPTKASLFYLI